ncbi:MAG: KOW domain-containing RNA-binding protein [Veillonellaceae bacterium]|nr:KOW domain-containing RNA-binding protein [Veillonellaceae bacterium]
MMATIPYGTIVIVTAGRTAGSCFMVVGTTAEGYRLLADGRKYPLHRPKRKNERHLRRLQLQPQLPEECRNGNRSVRDEEIRAAITQCRSASKEGGSDEQGRCH